MAEEIYAWAEKNYPTAKRRNALRWDYVVETLEARDIVEKFINGRKTKAEVCAEVYTWVRLMGGCDHLSENSMATSENGHCKTALKLLTV